MEKANAGTFVFDFLWFESNNRGLVLQALFGRKEKKGVEFVS